MRSFAIFGLAAALGAQAPESAVLLEQLADDAAWETTASRLVLEGRAATGPLCKALMRACRAERHPALPRILRILERLDLDAQSAVDPLLVAMPLMDPEDAARAVRALAVVARPATPSLYNRVRDALTAIDDVSSAQDFRRVSGAFTQVSSVIQLHSTLKADLPRALLLRQVKSKTDATAVVCFGLLENVEDDGDLMLALAFTRLRGIAPEIVGGTSSTGFSTKEALANRLARFILQHAPRDAAAACAYGYRLHVEPFRPLRLHAARELVALGPYGIHALPLLEHHLRWHGEDAELTKLVLNCVAAIGPEAASAEPLVKKFEDHEDPTVATAARMALRNVSSRK